MDLEKICHRVCDISRHVGDFIHDEKNHLKTTDVEVKSVRNFVTYVDKTSESMLIKELTKILPKAGFMVEENTVSKKGEQYNWIVDPLDGTTNFIHSIPNFSISIALMKDDEVVMGVVYEVNQQECFYAWKDSSAFLNGKEIHVSTAKTLANSLVSTGFPYNDCGKIDSYMDALKYFMQNSHGVRRLGSASVDLSYVACGRFEAFYEYELHPWDVAAGALLVQRAGGKVSDFKGSNNYIFGKEIIATNGFISDEFLTVMKNYFH